MTGWKKLKYLQKGISHVQNSTDCQDSVLIYEDEDCIVASLADGLGSLKYSEVAAQTATETVCKCFSELNNPREQFGTKEDLAQYILDAAVMNIQHKAIGMGVPLNEMDCTLIFVCVLKKIDYAIIGRLGDSAVCVIAEPKSYAVNDGNKSANGTNAILDKDAINHFDIQILDLDKNNIYGFILSSDGLENELYMKGSTHVNKTAELYFNAWFIGDDPVAVIEERLSKLTKIEDTPFDDDISVAVISRADKEVILPEDPKWLCTCGFRNYLQTTYCQRCHKDFSVLYQNIRFRDYGGKAAFFTEINKNPEEEKRIIGMQAEVPAVKDEIAVSNDDLVNGSGTGIKSVTQSKKSSTPEVQNSLETRVIGDKITGKETAIDPHEKSNGRVAPLSGNKTLLTESVMEKETGKVRRQDGIISKQAAAQKTVSDSMDEISGEKRQKSSSNSVEKTGIAKGQANGKHLAKSKKSRYNIKALKMMGILMAIALVIGISIGGIFVKIITSNRVSKLSKSVEELSEIVNQYEAEEDMEPVVPSMEDFSELEDGAYFWGELDDLNLPHGFGVLREDKIYYIGNFTYGKKNGEFLIIDSDGEYRMENYLDDELIPEEEEVPTISDEENSRQAFSGEKNLQRYETQYIANMREYPGNDNDLVITLKVGTVVYLIDKTEKEADGLYWVHVRTEEGYEGWILSEAINRQ